MTFTALPGVVAGLGIGTSIAASLEWGLVGVAVVLAGLSAWLGYRSHRSALVAGSLVAFAVVLLSARFLEASTGSHLAFPMVIVGGLGLVASHTASIVKQRQARVAT